MTLMRMRNITFFDKLNLLHDVTRKVRSHNLVHFVESHKKNKKEKTKRKKQNKQKQKKKRKKLPQKKASEVTTCDNLMKKGSG